MSNFDISMINGSKLTPNIMKSIYEVLQGGTLTEISEVCEAIGGRYHRQENQGRKPNIDFTDIRKQNLNINEFPFEVEKDSRFLSKTVYLGEFSFEDQTFHVFKSFDYSNEHFVIDYKVDEPFKIRDEVLAPRGYSYARFNMMWSHPEVEQIYPLPTNDHRAVDENLRGFGIGKMLLTLSEEALLAMGHNKLGVETAQPGIVSWLFRQGWILDKPEELTYQTLVDILEKNNQYESALDWSLLLVKSISE